MYALLLFRSCIVLVGIALTLSVTALKAEIAYPLPALESYNYDPVHRNRAIIDSQPVGILVVAFNRPEYFAQVLTSLETNPESQTMPFYFFLDGGPDAKQAENIALITASTIKNKTIIARPRNYGCPKNHIDSKRFMFDWCGFEKVIVLEDDMVVSPSFIRLNLALHAWARKKFSNVGVVQCSSYCYLEPEQKITRLNLVEASAGFWWSYLSYCLDKTVWNAMSPTLYTYEQFVDQIPHTDDCSKARSKPGLSTIAPAINAWVQHVRDTHIPPIIKDADKLAFLHGKPFKRVNRFLENYHAVSQDVMTAFALWCAGYVKINTVVNRARHIGEEGITHNKKIFDGIYKKITLDLFTDHDAVLDEFVIKS